MFGTDTAKRDLVLIALGILAAGFYLWFHPSIHPLSLGDNSLGDLTASKSIDYELNRLGYSYEEGSLTTYRVNPQVLNLVQTELNDMEYEGYGSGSMVRKVAPGFYWYSERKILSPDSESGVGEVSENQRLVQVELSESGELLAFQNPNYFFPNKPVETAFFEENMPDVLTDIQQVRSDSLLFELLQFRLTAGQNRNPDIIVQGDPTLFGADEAIEMGLYHLELSGWPVEYFTAGDPEPQVVRGVETARITFRGELPEISPSATEVTLDLLPTGTLISMDYEVVGEAAVLDQSEFTVTLGVRVVTVFLLAVWLLILFFIRIRLRLVDIKLSVLVAVLAGFALPLIFLMRQVHTYAYSYTQFSMEIVFGIFLSLGFLAASSSIVFFITTAVGDSLTREKWMDKLKTFDLVRLAMFYNRPVGMLIVRSVSYSFLMLASLTLIIYLIPNSYISVSQIFRADATILPSLEIIITSTFFFLLIVQTVLKICVGKMSGRTKRPIWIILLCALLFMMLNYLPVTFGPLSADLITVGFVGIAAGFIYVKEDFLTAFLSLTLMGIHLMSASGWVMEGSPDVSVFYVSILLTLVLLLLGIFGFYNGNPVDELPEYVPEYINELKKDERVKQELQIARTVQQSFLPSQMPNGHGIEIAAVCNPALETGGDYYDFIELSDGKLAVTIGDVSGKGIEAAFYMTFTKGVLHALSADVSSTPEMLSRINNLFLKNAKKGTFISLIFGILDVNQNTFRFSRGGHNPLLHFSAETGKINEYRPDGMGLGMANEQVFRENMKESVIELKKGDILVLFTDGVVEATDPRGRFYGDNRLKSMIKRNSRTTADAIIKTLTKDLIDFGGGSDPNDDMTAIVIKKT